MSDTTTIYAYPGYETRLVPATHWAWQAGGAWMAVTQADLDTWWDGADPADRAAAPDPWFQPIDEIPTEFTSLISPKTKRIRVFTRETHDKVYELDVPDGYDLATDEVDYPWEDSDEVSDSIDDVVVGDWEVIDDDDPS